MGYFGLTGYKCPRRSTVGSFIANLPEMVGAMVADSRNIVAIAEFSDGRYWQCRADEDSSIAMEVVSNLNISGDVPTLSDLDEECLRVMGFTEPSRGSNPNWRVEGSGL
jgi:hypothetical protein